MRKTMLILLMLAMVCGVSVARSESKVAVIRNKEVFKVIYKSEEPSSVKVTIADESGLEVFSEELISVHGFIRPYNFSELPKGDYIICVADGSGKNYKRVCFGSEPWPAHISKLASDVKKVVVAIPQGQNDFSVQILDRDDQLIYNEDQRLETGYAKVFNLKNLEQGATILLVNHLTGEMKAFKAE
ncbi:MAG: hypothetical protein HY015_02870 [Bacteroidetes bacterium]|nr:hypothetical protein [Bacteroidota bacterium]MBI3481912.1 hypothetical protein [Bacteroidota bacterium]